MLKRNTLAPNTRVRLSGFFWFRRLKPTVTDRLCMVPSSEKVLVGKYGVCDTVAFVEGRWC